MPNIINTVRLIMCDVDANNNKYWTGTLYDNNDVIVEWGRVGKASQSKKHPSAGQHFLDAKEKEKIRKGYTHLKTVSSNTPSISIISDVSVIAKKEIRTKTPVLDALIDRLIKANIHQITSSTQIQYNANTGLFTTPLGIVTPTGIDEARDILAKIKKARNLDDVKSDISQYLRIIPQDIGMKFDIRKIFGSDELLIKQNDILDSLQSSYQASQQPTTTGVPTLTANTPPVFNVEMDICTDVNERNRIQRKFDSTKKSNHSSHRLHIKEIYTVHIETVRSRFNTGKSIGNIQELWHGTKKANILSILKGGLKVTPPNTATIAGKLYGHGCYFSDQSTKSLNYSYGYWDGKYETNCFMFLCNVAMGNAFTPVNYYGSYPKSGYNSTFAKAGVSGVINNEMIVYNENQFDLTYLVEFE